MKNLNQSIVCSLVVAAAFVANGDVVMPNTSTIADIQAAIDNAQPGEVITLADGMYAFNQTLYVTNGVTLTGSHRRGSPARSAGDADKGASALGCDSLVGTLDFYGQPRVKHVSRKGVADIDIGAAESKYSPIGLRISFR